MLKRLSLLGALVALLTGCGGTAATLGQPRSALQASPIALTMARGVVAPARFDDARSQVVPGTFKTIPLLYVSDWASNHVYVFSYKTGKQLQRLGGFSGPYGQCVDPEGNVWIAQFSGFKAFKYAHGEDEPIKRLDTAGYAIGCWVDPTSGDLAVANFATASGSGNVQIWQKAQGTPKTYAPAEFRYFWAPAYDAKGDLFVESQAQDGTAGIMELVHGGTALRRVTLHGATIHYPGAVVWDGAHLGFTDQRYGGEDQTAIYRVTLSGANVTVFDTTKLSDRCSGDESDVIQPFVVPNVSPPNTIVGGNAWCSKRFNFWTYPPGGTPKSSLHDAPEQPLGQSVSRGT